MAAADDFNADEAVEIDRLNRITVRLNDVRSDLEEYVADPKVGDMTPFYLDALGAVENAQSKVNEKIRTLKHQSD